MKIGKEQWNSLEGILDGIWFLLDQGVKQSDSPFRYPVLASTAEGGCSARMVVLRHVSVPKRVLVCYTDARPPKVEEIRNCSQVSWLFYDPKTKIQLRASGQATLHTDDSFADHQWAATKIASRLNFCASRSPGTPVDKPLSGLPDFLLNRIPTFLESEMGRKNFMAIAARIDSFDWLMLSITGNRRARFEWKENRLRATWLVP